MMCWCSGNPASQHPPHAPWEPAYHGLVRVFVRSTVDAATSAHHRSRLQFIDIDGGRVTRVRTVSTCHAHASCLPSLFVALVLVLCTLRNAMPSTRRRMVQCRWSGVTQAGGLMHYCAHALQVAADAHNFADDIVVTATADGLTSASVSIPVTTDLNELPVRYNRYG